MFLSNFVFTLLSESENTFELKHSFHKVKHVKLTHSESTRFVKQICYKRTQGAISVDKLLAYALFFFYKKR